jgi:hypothetical protein
MLLKAVGLPLSTAIRVKKNRWEIPKGYRKAFGQFLKGIGKPLGNAQILPSANRRGGTIA